MLIYPFLIKANEIARALKRQISAKAKLLARTCKQKKKKKTDNPRPMKSSVQNNDLWCAKFNCHHMAIIYTVQTLATIL